MEPGWQKYIQTLDSRLERLESNVEKLLEFKWQIIGGGIVVSAMVTVLFQIVYAAIK